MQKISPKSGFNKTEKKHFAFSFMVLGSVILEVSEKPTVNQKICQAIQELVDKSNLYKIYFSGIIVENDIKLA